ncbi:MAG: hypothetical protein L0H59_06815, partial [Tomitella sp.]|nr:hypothetical protein [Tomitella sp.]
PTDPDRHHFGDGGEYRSADAITRLTINEGSETSYTTTRDLTDAPLIVLRTYRAVKQFRRDRSAVE